MSRTIRVIVVNTDEEVAPDLRAVLLGIEGVKIVAELDEPALAGQAVEQFPAEVMLIHLDPNPAGVMDVVAPVIEATKDRVVAVAMTEDRDAELIMRAMRAGMREFLWKPFPPEQLAEVLQRVASDPTRSSKRTGRLLTVMGAAGGVGATCLSTNLAVELAQLDQWAGAPKPGVRPRVAVVDLDFRFGQVAMQLDVHPTYTIAELCETAEQIDQQMIERAACKHASGAQVLARPADFNQCERISAAQSAAALGALLEHFDFLVVDMPARFDPSARAVFDMSDGLLVVLQLLVPSVRNADRLLQEFSRSGYAMERIRLVCSRADRDENDVEPSDVESTLKRRFDFYLPNEWKTISTAVNMGAPLLMHAPKSKLRLAYRQMAVQLAGATADGAPSAPPEPPKKKRFSFFARSS